jgi:hypothetical protein
MRRVVAVTLLVMLLVPGMAWAGSSTDAALGLGAFAALGTILLGAAVLSQPAIAVPPPVAVAPPPVYAPAPPPPPVVYAPSPRVVYPPPPVVYAPPAVVYAPPPVVYGPAYGYPPHFRRGHHAAHRHYWPRY